MDAKLNPISNSSAGIPLSVESSTSHLNQADAKQLGESAVKDTLETSDREGDGRKPLSSDGIQSKNCEESHEQNGECGKQKGQGSLLDLNG